MDVGGERLGPSGQNDVGNWCGGGGGWGGESTLTATPQQDIQQTQQPRPVEEVDRGGQWEEEEEYLEGFPAVGKALKELAVKAIWWIGKQVLRAMYWFDRLEQ